MHIIRNGSDVWGNANKKSPQRLELVARTAKIMIIELLGYISFFARTVYLIGNKVQSSRSPECQVPTVDCAWSETVSFLCATQRRGKFMAAARKTLCRNTRTPNSEHYSVFIIRMECLVCVLLADDDDDDAGNNENTYTRCNRYLIWLCSFRLDAVERIWSGWHSPVNRLVIQFEFERTEER